VYICLDPTPGNARWKRIDNNPSYDALATYSTLVGYDGDNGYSKGAILTLTDQNAYICVANDPSGATWRNITTSDTVIRTQPSGGFIITAASGTGQDVYTIKFRPSQTVPVAGDPYDLLHGSFIGIGTLDHNRIRGISEYSVLGEVGTAGSGTGSIDAISATADHQVLRRKANALGFGKIVGSGIENSSISVAHLELYPARTVVANSTGATAQPSNVTASVQYTYMGYGENGTLAFNPIVGSGITQGSVNPDRMQSQAAGTLIGRLGGSAGFPGVIAPQSGVTIDSSNLLLGIPGICGHRLTLVPETPYLASGVTSSTVYFTPTGKEFSGMVSTYDGSKWVTKSYPQTSVSLTSTASGTNFDFFFYDNNGVGLLEKVNWSNDTTRATALIRQDGVYVKSGVSSGLFVGTGRTGATDKAEFTPFSTAAPVRCFLTNHYNKKQVSFRKRENATSWTYNSNTPRPLNNNSRNRFEFVIPMIEDQVDSIGMVTQGNQNTGKVGFCLNATNRYDIGYKHSLWPAATTINGLAIGRMITFPSGGFNFIQMLESSDSSVTMTFWSDTVTEGGMVSDFYC